ncbi:MAG: glycoside hydrolase family 15 protein [Bacillota bacterium]
MKRIFIFITILFLSVPSLTHSQVKGTAPASTWSPGNKAFVGTSASDTSKVWFTGTKEGMTEVFYPTVDTPNSKEFMFLVGDKNHTWVDDEKSQQHTVKQIDSKALIWEHTSTDIDGKWQLTKRIFSDPNRNTLIQRVTFKALKGNVNDYLVYVFQDPAMNNSANDDTSKTLTYKEKTMLVASDEDKVAALALSLPFKSGLVSNGFVGVNDGYTDLLSNMDSNFKMDWAYNIASDGNVAQIGLLDFGYSKQHAIVFHSVLGFGKNEQEAMKTAYDSLTGNIKETEKQYINEWKNYTKQLNTFEGTVDNQYYLAAMVIKASQDKTTGAMVAGLGIPWGDTNPWGGNKSSVYHLVWARDLYKYASAILVAGDQKTANQAVDFLFNYQQDPKTGRFPQNSWTDGKPFWNHTQMDQQGMPIILAWKLRRTDLWPKIKITADYIVKAGPWTEQERWEEQSGYSPSTIAAEIAGLVCAADIATANGDKESAKRYLETADFWQSQVDNWTFTTTGLYGNKKYYIRINDNKNPNDGQKIILANEAGTWDEREIVDAGFLELVRMGVKSANDPYILESLPEVDKVIKRTIPGKGSGWYRYNHDRYGETKDGRNWDGSGQGRLWPLLTAERGIYEIARGNSGKPYLKTVKAFSSKTGTISEQVWDLNAPKGYEPGTPTRSMQPLNWSMAEYINLLASIYQNDIADIPAVVRDRYVQ